MGREEDGMGGGARGRDRMGEWLKWVEEEEGGGMDWGRMISGGGRGEGDQINLCLSLFLFLSIYRRS